MSTLDEAIILASRIHKGQIDKSGEPYIIHPLRLMLKFREDNERIVSVLHDVIEDGDLSIADLKSYGWSDEIVAAIDCLSKRKNEQYEDFIERLSINDLAKKVKIADLKDNLDLTRLRSIGADDLIRINKYHKALKFLGGL